VIDQPATIPVKPGPPKRHHGALRYILGAVGAVIVLTVVGTLVCAPSCSKALKATVVHAEGETVRVGHMAYIIHRSGWTTHIGNIPIPGQRPSATYLIVQLTARNEGTEPHTIPAFELLDQNGAKYESSGNDVLLSGCLDILEDLNPSVARTGLILFDVPKDRQYRIKLPGGFWSSESVYVSLNPK
jgi:hypothetical protein